MKLAIKLAWRNLIGAGLRTWLTVIVLSFSFVVIIWLKGIMTGWDHEAKTDMTNWEIGDGQYWHSKYDPYDPFTLTESHALIPEEIKPEIARGNAEAVLVTQGTIYPEGRMQPIIIKGIDPGQKLLLLPTQKLDTAIDAIPAIIGSIMAKSCKLAKGDYVTIRWRDTHGTFDATEILVTDVFETSVSTADMSQVYIPLEKLQEMMLLPGEATILTFRDGEVPRPAIVNWTLKPKKELTASVDKIIKAKSAGQSVLYLVLLLLAMLAIFDSQILSIFRRQKEIGTYIALGYTRSQVVGLFTVEGTMYAVLAALLSAAYGLPFLTWQAKVGWTMPIDTSELGMTVAKTLFPIYSAGLVVSTVLIITIVTAIVSYWPSRRIAKMNPTEALRGKLQ
jgi:putative ABC transport system permease protein